MVPRAGVATSSPKGFTRFCRGMALRFRRAGCNCGTPERGRSGLAFPSDCCDPRVRCEGVAAELQAGLGELAQSLDSGWTEADAPASGCGRLLGAERAAGQQRDVELVLGITY